MEQVRAQAAGAGTAYKGSYGICRAPRPLQTNSAATESMSPGGGKERNLR